MRTSRGIKPQKKIVHQSNFVIQIERMYAVTLLFQNDGRRCESDTDILPSLSPLRRVLPDSQGCSHPRIAIVGGAAAGITMVYRLSMHSVRYRGARIVVFDSRAKPWGGPAHTDCSPGLRVNMRSELHDLHGLLPFRDACHMFGWRSDAPPVRRLLGAYLELAFLTARVRLELEGVRVESIQSEIVAIEPGPSVTYVLTLANDRRMSFDYVVLALGNAPPTPPADLGATTESIDAAA